MDLVAVFIDLTMAFETVNREALWVILSKLGCRTKFVNLIRQFHDDMTGQILSDGEASEPFSTSSCVKQGCVLVLVLYNLFFTCVLNHAIRDLEQVSPSASARQRSCSSQHLPQFPTDPPSR